MSRSWQVLLSIAASGAFAAPLLAIAQEAGPPSDADRAIAERMMAAGGRVTPDRSRNACLRTVRQGEIVVCAPDEEQFRVPSTTESDPESAQALNDGRLHPPDVGGGGIFRGKATASGMCLVPPCPPEAPYIIDLSTIPVAPAGSDADRIARGELRAP